MLSIIGAISFGPKEQLIPKASTFNPSKTLTIVRGSHPDKLRPFVSKVIVAKTGRSLHSLTAKILAFNS